MSQNPEPFFNLMIRTFYNMMFIDFLIKIYLGFHSHPLILARGKKRLEIRKKDAINHQKKEKILAFHSIMKVLYKWLFRLWIYYYAFLKAVKDFFKNKIYVLGQNCSLLLYLSFLNFHTSVYYYFLLINFPLSATSYVIFPFSFGLSFSIRKNKNKIFSCIFWRLFLPAVELNFFFFFLKKANKFKYNCMKLYGQILGSWQ